MIKAEIDISTKHNTVIEIKANGEEQICKELCILTSIITKKVLDSEAERINFIKNMIIMLEDAIDDRIFKE